MANNNVQAQEIESPTLSLSTRLLVVSSKCSKRPSAKTHPITCGRTTDGNEPRRNLTSYMTS